MANEHGSSVITFLSRKNSNRWKNKLKYIKKRICIHFWIKSNEAKCTIKISQKKKLNGIPKNAPVERNECGSDVCVPHK